MQPVFLYHIEKFVYFCSECMRTRIDANDNKDKKITKG